MGKLDFLLTGERSSGNNFVEVHDNQKAILGYVSAAVDANQKAVLNFIMANRVVDASTSFINIIKKPSGLYLEMDALVPESANKIVDSMRKQMVLISFELDSVPVGFLTRPVQYNPKRNCFYFVFPQKFFRLQRRSFYRLEVQKEMVKLKHNFRNNTDHPELPVKDISEGGLSFYSMGDYLSFFVKTENDDGMIDIQSEETFEIQLVIRKIHVIKPVVKILYGRKSVVHPWKYQVGAKFTAMERRDKTILQDFIFKEQMEDIKKRSRI